MKDLTNQLNNILLHFRGTGRADQHECAEAKDLLRRIKEEAQFLDDRIKGKWFKDIFTNRPKESVEVIIRRESKKGRITYEISQTFYDNDDDLMWDTVNKYKGNVTHFQYFTLKGEEV
jgi:hypothetical protein